MKKQIITFSLIIGTTLGLTLTSYAKVIRNKYTTQGDPTYIAKGVSIYEGYCDGHSNFDGSHITLFGEIMDVNFGAYIDPLWKSAVDDAGNPYTGWVDGLYFQNGKPLTEGWQTIDGRRYYFKKSELYGVCSTPAPIESSTSQIGSGFKWREIDGKYFLFRNTGVWGIPVKESVTLDEYGGHKIHWNSDGSFKSIDGVHDADINDLSSELRAALSSDMDGNSYSVIEQLNTRGLAFRTPLSSGWDKGIEYVKFSKGIGVHNDGENGNCNITEFDFSRFPILESVSLNLSNISKLDFSNNTEISRITLCTGDAKKEIILPNTGKEVIIVRPSYELGRPVFDGATGQNLVPTIYNDFRTVAVGQTILVS